MTETSDSMFMPEVPPDDGGMDPEDIGKTIEETAAQVAGAGGSTDDPVGDAARSIADAAADGDSGDSPDDVFDDLSKIGEEVLEKMGRATEYRHDVNDEPPPRTGPYPAGGPS
jgi:hypothetical protein